MSITPQIEGRHLIGGLLKKRREELNLSIEDLAENVGLSPSSISRIENGKFSATIDTLLAISKELKCKINFVTFE